MNNSAVLYISGRGGSFLDTEVNIMSYVNLTSNFNQWPTNWYGRLKR